MTVEAPRRARRLVVGRPMQSDQMEETLLPKTLALPIFASDPLSSVAYATESAMVVLVGVSAAAAALRLPDRDRDLRPARDRRPLVHADRARVRDERRRVHRRAREPRNAAEPRRGGRAAHRLRADGRGVDLGRRLRDHLVRDAARSAPRRAVDRGTRPDRAREPARRARVGPALRAADVPVRDGDRHARRGGARRARDAVTRTTPSRRTRFRSVRGRSRSSSCSGRSRPARPP